MSALSGGLYRPGIIIVIAVLLGSRFTHSAPVYEDDTTQIAEYESDGSATGGCYYNFQHYREGDRILTNEPCLNCTCHNRMLMCYLRVCPFTKAIGQDCKVEKRPDQCCPIITCPQVPVQLLTSTTITPETTSSSTDLGFPDNYGCSVDEKFYADGVQLPLDSRNPCELCYCIRNRTTCVMQECTLRVAGCRPVYLPGVCCPVKYDCDYDDETGTTPGLIMTTTTAPRIGNAPQCYHRGNYYDDGQLIYSTEPCNHCYCFHGDIACAVQDCGAPMKSHGKNCTALPPPPGECCPTTYECEDESAVTDSQEILRPDVHEVTTKKVEDEDVQTTQSALPIDEESFPGADNSIPEVTDLQSNTDDDAQAVSKPTAESSSSTESTTTKISDDDSEQKIDGVSTTEIVITETPIKTDDRTETSETTSESVIDDKNVQTDKPIVSETTMKSVSDELSTMSSVSAITEASIVDETESQTAMITEPTKDAEVTEKSVIAETIVSEDATSPKLEATTATNEMKETTDKHVENDESVEPISSIPEVQQEILPTETISEIPKDEKPIDTTASEQSTQGTDVIGEIGTESASTEQSVTNEETSVSSTSSIPSEVSTEASSSSELPIDSSIPEKDEETQTAILETSTPQVSTSDVTSPKEDSSESEHSADSITESSVSEKKPEVTETITKINEDATPTITIEQSMDTEIPTEGPIGIDVTQTQSDNVTDQKIPVTDHIHMTVSSNDVDQTELHTPESLITETVHVDPTTYHPPINEIPQTGGPEQPVVVNVEDKTQEVEKTDVDEVAITDDANTPTIQTIEDTKVTDLPIHEGETTTKTPEQTSVNVPSDQDEQQHVQHIPTAESESPESVDKGPTSTEAHVTDEKPIEPSTTMSSNEDSSIEDTPTKGLTLQSSSEEMESSEESSSKAPTKKPDDESSESSSEEVVDVETEHVEDAITAQSPTDGVSGFTDQSTMSTVSPVDRQPTESVTETGLPIVTSIDEEKIAEPGSEVGSEEQHTVKPQDSEVTSDITKEPEVTVTQKIEGSDEEQATEKTTDLPAKSEEPATVAEESAITEETPLEMSQKPEEHVTLKEDSSSIGDVSSTPMASNDDKLETSSLTAESSTSEITTTTRTPEIGKEDESKPTTEESIGEESSSTALSDDEHTSVKPSEATTLKEDTNEIPIKPDEQSSESAPTIPTETPTEDEETAVSDATTPVTDHDVPQQTDKTAEVPTTEKSVEKEAEVTDKPIDEVIQTTEQNVEKEAESTVKTTDEVAESTEKSVDTETKVTEQSTVAVSETTEKSVDEESKPIEQSSEKEAEPATTEKSVEKDVETTMGLEVGPETTEKTTDEASESTEKSADEDSVTTMKSVETEAVSTEQTTENDSEPTEKSPEQLETITKSADKESETTEESVSVESITTQKSIEKESLPTEESTSEESESTEKSTAQESVTTTKSTEEEILPTEKTTTEKTETTEKSVESELQTTEKSMDDQTETTEKSPEKDVEAAEETNEKEEPASVTETAGTEQQPAEPTLAEEGQVLTEIGVKVGEDDKPVEHHEESTTKASEEGPSEHETKPSIDDKIEDDKIQPPMMETIATDKPVVNDEETATETLPKITEKPIEGAEDAGTQVPAMTTQEATVESSESPITPGETISDDKTSDVTEKPTIIDETVDLTTKIPLTEEKVEVVPASVTEIATEAPIAEAEMTSVRATESATDKPIINEMSTEESVASSAEPTKQAIPEESAKPATESTDVADEHQSTIAATEQPAEITENSETSTSMGQVTDSPVLPAEVATEAAISEESSTPAKDESSTAGTEQTADDEKPIGTETEETPVEEASSPMDHDEKPSSTEAEHTPVEHTTSILVTEAPASSEPETETAPKAEETSSSPATPEEDIKTETPLVQVPLIEHPEKPIEESEHTTEHFASTDDKRTEPHLPIDDHQVDEKPFDMYGPPAGIPGEGNCLIDGQSYGNNTSVPPANPCQLSCQCVSSIIQCELVKCSPPPSHLSNCMPIHNTASGESCCPMYSCDSSATVGLETDNQMGSVDRETTTPESNEIPTVPSTTDTKVSEEPVTQAEESIDAGQAVGVTSATEETIEEVASEEASSSTTEPTHVEATESSSSPETIAEKQDDTKPIESTSESTVLPEQQTTEPIQTELAPEFNKTDSSEQSSTAGTVEEPATTEIPMKIEQQTTDVATSSEVTSEAADEGTTSVKVVEMESSTPAVSQQTDRDHSQVTESTISIQDDKSTIEDTSATDLAHEPEEKVTSAPTEMQTEEHVTTDSPIAMETKPTEIQPVENAATDISKPAEEQATTMSNVATQEDTITQSIQQTSSVAPTAEDDEHSSTMPQHDIVSSPDVVNKFADEFDITTTKSQVDEKPVDATAVSEESSLSTESPSSQAPTTTSSETSEGTIVTGQTPVEASQPEEQVTSSSVEPIDEQKKEQPITTESQSTTVESNEVPTSASPPESMMTTMKTEDEPVETSSTLAPPTSGEASQTIDENATTKIDDSISEEATKAPEQDITGVHSDEGEQTTVKSELESTVMTTPITIEQDKTTSVVDDVSAEQTIEPVVSVGIVTETPIDGSTMIASTEKSVDRVTEEDDTKPVTSSDKPGEITPTIVDKPEETSQATDEQPATVGSTEIDQSSSSLPESSTETIGDKETEVTVTKEPSISHDESSSSTEQNGDTSTIQTTQPQTSDSVDEENASTASPSEDMGTTPIVKEQTEQQTTAKLPEEDTSVVAGVSGDEQHHETEDGEPVKEDKPSGEEIIVEDQKPTQEDKTEEEIKPEDVKPSNEDTTLETKPADEVTTQSVESSSANEDVKPSEEPATTPELHEDNEVERPSIPEVHEDKEVEHPLIPEIHEDKEVQHPLIPEVHEDKEVQHPLIPEDHEEKEVEHPLVPEVHGDKEVEHPLTPEVHEDKEVEHPLTPEVHEDKEVEHPLTPEGHEDKEVEHPLIPEVHEDKEVEHPLTPEVHEDKEVEHPLIPEVHEDKEVEHPLIPEVHEEKEVEHPLTPEVHEDKEVEHPLIPQVHEDKEVEHPPIPEVHEDKEVEHPSIPEVHEDKEVQHPLIPEVHEDKEVQHPLTPQVHEDKEVEHPLIPEYHEDKEVQHPVIPEVHEDKEVQHPNEETEHQQTSRPIVEHDESSTPLGEAGNNETTTEIGDASHSTNGDLEYPDHPEHPEHPVDNEENPHFPVNSGTYLNPDEDYDEDDQTVYGPGTCRYGGKVYVSAQQIPRDDPCDFCFCFRSDIICLQQSCPPPIPDCHEEPIRGFCCPRYECPVSMATSVNITTTTTTTTTTVPPHFLSHAYKGAARHSGCQIGGKAYQVGQVIKSASGPCLHCTCGGDGNMKCDPRVCSPEPTLRQMIAAATARRRR